MFFLCLFISFNAFSTTSLTIYLAPNGVDTQDGLTSSRPILTLKRAHDLVTAHFKKSPSNVNIQLAPGVYYNQTVTWTATNPLYQIRFFSASATNKATFDGRSSSTAASANLRSFFILKSSSGKATNLSFEHLAIRYYAEAISLNGNRDDEKTGFNSNNKILFCSFDKIGSKYHVDKNLPAYAVVRFVNSRKNEVRGNVFSNIENYSQQGLLHSIYVAHLSHENTFEGNSFRKQPGDPLRIRDYSNFNVITKNEFDSAGSYAYSEWYCEASESSDCTKKIPECPSWGSKMYSNVYRGSGLFHYYVRPNFQNSNSACKTKAPANAENRRLRTSSNVITNESVVQSVLNNTSVYGICPSRTHCVSASGGCYADGSGTTNHVCISNNWISRSEYRGPVKTSQGYLIQSLLNNRYISGVCPRSTDCVSSGGHCYVSGGGTANHLCQNNNWKNR
ncbi:hypothetical protein [Peredibacter starrii]|uniref:DUF1565 domain-containing protein n=1 Tax=Peredibacter starrii TaxID=28202 RepID=A0AAX4HLG2_9BACT|nr:hypothetical protein [Peredibacter starrii]WPU64056.1 hypothetical protein SOO65_15270 [Peredibacter starrii]